MFIFRGTLLLFIIFIFAMKRYISFLVAGILFLTFLPKDSFSSHAMGSEITYECINPNQYLIKVKFYRDCEGINAPPDVDVEYFSPSCGTGTNNLTLDLDLVANPGGAGVSVIPTCASLIDSSSCNGGSFPGSEIYTYTGILNLPQNCTDWIIGYGECCRNAAITNLQNPDNFSLYTFATINNTMGCNNSPFFTIDPIIYSCDPTNYNQGAVDIDGDSLVYRMVQPTDDYQIPIAYTAPFTINYPFSTTTGTFNFDPATGQMSFFPDILQVAVVSLIVEEYRNGVLIGTAMREIQVIRIPPNLCTNNPIDIGTGILNLQGGGLIDSLSVQVCPNTLVTFDLTVTDIDGDSVTISSDASTAIPGSNFPVNTAVSTVTSTFSWVPTDADTGIHQFRVTSSDNGCPFRSINNQVYTINVFDRVIIKPNRDTLVYCGIPLDLEAVGGTFFLWTPAAGLDNPASATPSVTNLTVSTMYYVRSDCGMDSIYIDVQSGFNLEAGNDSAICKNQTIHFNASASPGFAPYAYTWTPATGLSNPNVNDPFATPLVTTSYKLQVVSSVGCVREDTLKITVTGSAPRVVAFATPDTVCPGESVRLDLEITPGECGINSSPCASSIDNFELATGSDWTGIGTPYEGENNDGRILYLYRFRELRDSLGITGGTIKELSFRVAIRGSTQPYNNFTIKMGCTTATSITSFVGGLDVVYNPKPHFATSGWNTHVLDNPFDWDGTSNLLIEVCFDNASSSGDDQIYYTSTPFNSVVYAASNFGSGCNLNLSAFGQDRADIRFGLCIPSLANANIIWNPSTNITNPTIPNPLAQVFGYTNFTANVSQGSCVGIGSTIVNVDTAITVTAGPDTSLCVASSIQLYSNISGTLSPAQLTCGVNGTTTSPSTSYSFGNLQAVAITPGPFHGTWENSRLQFIIRKSELTTAGISQGIMTNLAFNVTSIASNGRSFDNFTVKMGCTNLTAMPNDFESGLDVVFTPKNIFTSLGWNTFLFDNPYDWDGFSNILVEFCFENAGVVQSDNIAISPTSFNSTLHAFGSYVPGCSLDLSTAGGQIALFNTRPDIQLGVSPAPLGNLTYTWSPNMDISDPAIEDPIVSPTISTTYTLEVSDGNCVATDQVTIFYYTDYDANVFGANVGCNGASDGNAVSAPVGGVAPYDFLWSTTQTAMGATSDTVFDLFAGTYAVTITDNNGCLASDSVTITVPPPLDVTLDSTEVSCAGGSDGSATGTAFGGTSPYSFQWSSGDDSLTAINLNIGIYSTTVTDASGCITEDSIEVLQPTPISLTLDSVDLSCFGVSDGEASVVATGGTQPYTYLWTDSQVTATATGIAAGIYLVIVTDANDCIEGGFIEVLQPDSFSVTASGVDATCFGGSDGEGIATVSGDTVNYSFSWGASGPFTAYATGLSPGLITVTATDNITNCDETTNVTIGQPAEIQLVFDTTSISCFGGSDGSATVSVSSGGIPPFTYLWSNTRTDDTVINLSTGESSVVVSDSLGCLKFDTISLVEPDQISIANTGISPVSCFGFNDGSIETSTSGGTPPFTYLWNNGQTTATAANLPLDSTYSITVTDANNCKDSLSSMTITQPTALVIDQVDVDSLCPGEATGRIVASASGGVPPYSFTLNNGSLSNTDGDFRGLEAGNYLLEITDQNNCPPIDTPLVVVPFDSNHSII